MSRLLAVIISMGLLVLAFGSVLPDVVEETHSANTTSLTGGGVAVLDVVPVLLISLILLGLLVVVVRGV